MPLSKHHLAHRAAHPGAMRCLFPIALVAFITLMRNTAITSQLPAWLAWATIAISGICYIPLAVIGHLAPNRVSPRIVCALALGCAVAGCTLCRISLDAGITMTGGVTKTALLFLAGDTLVNIARTWASVGAVLGLLCLDEPQRYISISCLGVGTAYLILLICSPLVARAPLAVECACLIALIVSARIFDVYGTLGLTHAESPSSLSVANPFSFIPLASHLYVCIFLFEITFGFVASFSLIGMPGSVYLLVGVLVLCVGIWCRWYRRSQGASRQQAGEDIVFAGCFLTVMLALLLSPASAQLGNLVPILLSVGSQCFYALMLSVLAQCSKRNTVASLCVVATGLACSSTGSATGFAFKVFISSQGASSTLATVSSGLFIFLIVAYVFLGMRSYSFAGQFDAVAPITTETVRQENSHDVARDGAMTQCPAADTGGPKEVRSEKDGIAPYAPSSADSIDLKIELIAAERQLTAREVQIVRMLARGRNGAYIQEKLVISRNTVKTHIRHIYAKLDVHSQQELIDLVGSDR